MVLSRMILDLTDADARRDFADAYEMHATLMRLVDAGSSKPLWRLEQARELSAPIVLVQTDEMPDPRAVVRGPGPYFQSFESKHNRLLEVVAPGERLRFRVRANVTVKRDGKRRGLVDEHDQLAWLQRQIEGAGGELLGARVSESRREVFGRRRGRPITVHGVTFDGALLIRDSEGVRALAGAGIGHARAFGFGLLTLSR